MKLVIAEKPSVAQSLARVIGATKRQDGYLEGNGYLVSWCVGHLVELSAPERYDERFAKWRVEDLPILPERFLYEVSTGTRKQYQVLKHSSQVCPFGFSFQAFQRCSHFRFSSSSVSSGRIIGKSDSLQEHSPPSIQAYRPPWDQ